MSETELDRRGFLCSLTAATGAALGGASALTDAVAASAAPARRRGDGDGGQAATFHWLGCSGWRVEIGSQALLVDPYLSRFDTGLSQGRFNPATELTVNATEVDRLVGDPATVLVTHSHWDHFNDVPHIVDTTDARVIGTTTTCNLALAYDVPADQLCPVKGGEVFDFGDHTVEVVASLHSRTAAYSIALPGVRDEPPPRPRTVADLPEGDTLAFHVTIANGPSVFVMGASDFVERNLTGLAPDVAMIAVPFSDATYAYVPRLIEALDRPETVVPVHWDNIETPLQNPPRIGPEPRRRLDSLVATVRRTAPRTRIVIPDYLTGYTFS